MLALALFVSLGTLQETGDAATRLKAIFSPVDAMKWRNAERHRARSSTMTPSQEAHRPKLEPERAPGERYTTASNGSAIDCVRDEGRSEAVEP